MTVGGPDPVSSSGSLTSGGCPWPVPGRDTPAIGVLEYSTPCYGMALSRTNSRSDAQPDFGRAGWTLGAGQNNGPVYLRYEWWPRGEVVPFVCSIWLRFVASCCVKPSSGCPGARQVPRRLTVQRRTQVVSTRTVAGVGTRWGDEVVRRPRIESAGHGDSATGSMATAAGRRAARGA